MACNILTHCNTNEKAPQACLHVCVCVWAPSGRSLRTHVADRNNGEGKVKSALWPRLLAFFSQLVDRLEPEQGGGWLQCVCVCMCVCVVIAHFHFNMSFCCCCFLWSLLFCARCAAGQPYLYFFLCFFIFCCWSPQRQRQQSKSKRTKVVLCFLYSYAKVNELFRCCLCVSDVFIVVVLR